ncbi:MAG: ROK family protein [Bifidobacteriaceae bacterium]|jgi:predicted NBD/HSP70 family sugar kinase|nr:ROK family protein [Bifidobacteriaceae bacterium]
MLIGPPNPLPAKGASSTSALRATNIRAILAALRLSKVPMTVIEAATATELSRPTAEAILADLAAHGLVSAVDARRAGALGRPPRAYRFAAERGLAIGVDADPREIRAIAADLSGAGLRRAGATGQFDHAEAAQAAIVSLVEQMAGDGLGAAKLTITLGLPAIVDADGHAWRSVVVPDWIEQNLPAAIQAALPGASVAVDNDANLAAAAEFANQTVPGAQGLAVIQVGDRVSASLIVDGRLVRGHRGAAAEIGALGLLRWGKSVDSLKARMETATIEDCLASTDPGNRAAVDAFAQDLAIGVAALVLATAPDAVVVGGGLSAAGESLLGPLRQALASRLLYQPTVVAAAHGGDGVLRGALDCSLERAFAELADQAILS